MVKKLLQTKNAIYQREKCTKAKVAKGPKPMIPPPQGKAPANLWKQHHAYPAYYGRPDGQIWSAKVGKVLKGSIKSDGYNYIHIHIQLDRKMVPRSRFNLSLALGRAIRAGFDCDHILPVSRGGGDDWANLQELSKPDHNRKTALDNPNKGKKAGITQGISIIARHTATGSGTRFDSVKEAVRELKIQNRVIERSLKGETVKGYYVFAYTPEYLAEQADLPGEIWLEAVSSWGLLPNIKASNCGRIQDSRRRRTYGYDLYGYKGFGATIDKKMKPLAVHDVITRTFHGPPTSSDHTQDHINGDPSDNRATNLRWATRSEQGRNMRTNRSVVQLDLITGAQLAAFGSIAAAAEAVGVTPSAIHRAANGLSRSAGRFIWNYSGGPVLDEAPPSSGTASSPSAIT
jgi:hypothetical protein